MIRLVGVLVCMALLAGTGCGTMKTTLAQDLAWERFNQCAPSHSSISLHHIDPDGRVWVTYGSADHRQVFNAWDECMKRAAVNQGRAGTAVAPPATEVAVHDDGWRSARWNVGDEWAWRYEGSSGVSISAWRILKIEALGGEPHYVIHAGDREVFLRVSDFAFTRETLNGRVWRASRPTVWRWVDFPLAVGKAWEMKWTDERPSEGTTTDIARRCVAEALEKVTVPAGTFPTMRVACYELPANTKTQTIWWAPALRHFARAELTFPSGTQVRELVTYRLQ
jgi:hypothetical protein